MLYVSYWKGFVISTNFFNMERIARKEMSSSKKLFRVSSEVHSVLQRKHDKWSPLRAYDRLKKDLHVFHVMCKVLLSFFAKFGTEPNEDAACDGKTVKMFSHLIRKCLDDDDFVSGKQETKFLGVRISISRIFFLQSVRRIFFNMGVSHLFFVDCAIDLDVMSNEDLDKVVSGEMADDEKKELSVKTTLELVNLFTTMYSIRKEATESALRFLLTHAKDNDVQGIGLKRKSKFEIIDDVASSSEDVVKRKRVETIVVNKKCSKVDNVVTAEPTIDEYELRNFSITDTGVINFNGDLMFT